VVLKHAEEADVAAVDTQQQQQQQQTKPESQHQQEQIEEQEENARLESMLNDTASPPPRESEPDAMKDSAERDSSRAVELADSAELAMAVVRPGGERTPEQPPEQLPDAVATEEQPQQQEERPQQQQQHQQEIEERRVIE